MNADVLAEWLRRRGHQVIRTASSYWYDQGPRTLQAFPYHWLLQPGMDELRGLLEMKRAVGLRYSAPVGAKAGMVSYHVVQTERAYSLEMLPKKARHDVRKGLAHASVERVTFAGLADAGWQARAETLRRHGRTGAECRAWWNALCLSAEGLPGFEAWAVTAGGLIAASLITFVCDDCCSILYQQSMTRCLSQGVNNALTHVVTVEMLKRPGISSIFYGLQSLDAPASVDRFKFRMRYRPMPVRQCVVFHPFLAPFFNDRSHRLLQHLHSWWSGNASLAKAEGMLRFYLEGQRPLHDQAWPECLQQTRYPSLEADRVC